MYDGVVAEQAGRPRLSRGETREVAELRAIGERHPELADAVAMHLELLELQRRVQTRIPLPSLNLSADLVAEHQATGRPLLQFENIPLELTDLRLIVRQTSDVLRRFGSLDDADYQKAQALGRDDTLLTVAAQWYRHGAAHRVVAPVGLGSMRSPQPPQSEAQDGNGIDHVLALAMRPFLIRCAEALQRRPELHVWTHPYCPLCGGEADFAVITPQAERHLICARCTLHWKFEPLTCPYCGNDNRALITSFATPDGQYRVYACDECRRYLKAYDGRRAVRPVMPVVDSVATLPLDAAAMQRGYEG